MALLVTEELPDGFRIIEEETDPLVIPFTLPDDWTYDLTHEQPDFSDANCHGLADGMQPDGRDREAVHMAKRVCLACPIRAECLEYAEQAGMEYGVWGGRLFKGWEQ